MDNHPHPHRLAEATHFWAGLMAVSLLAAAVVGGTWYARGLEARMVHAAAPVMFDQKDLGTALQSEAFRHPDLLPMYGSSEMRIPDRYHASTLFRDYPTGFTVFPVGKAGTTCLVMLQWLASAGPELRGRKVAISLTPGWFCEGGTLDADAYAGNFSRLHAYALAFSTDVSLQVRQGGAQRMLDYPATLEGDPLLQFALERLDAGGADDLALYYAALPLGKLRGLVYRLQDHAETVFFLWHHGPLEADVPHRPRHLDWQALHSRATREYEAVCDNNPFGIANPLWEGEYKEEARRRKGRHREADFRTTVRRAKEWTDFDLLLRALDELGAQPLLLSTPLHGRFSEYQGVSAATRQAFYDKLNRRAMAHGRQVISFADHDTDRLFMTDLVHPGPGGWVYYDEALDAFFHDTRAPFMPPEGTPYPLNPLPPPAGRGDARGLEGSVDRADGEQISGWAWDRSRPDTPLRVELYDGQIRLATLVAAQFRKDLIENGKGDGRHAFRYPVPAALKDGKKHRIEVRFAGTTASLRRSPQEIGPLAPGRPQDPAGRGDVRSLEGAVDRADGEQISGWAWDRSRPDTPLRVELYDGQIRLATLVAAQFRKDLIENGKGDGRHAFRYPVPAALKDGKKHRIEVRFAGTTASLRRSPQEIGPLAPGRPQDPAGK